MKFDFSFIKQIKNKQLWLCVGLGILIVIIFLTSGIFGKTETVKEGDVQESTLSKNLYNVSALEYSQNLEGRLKRVLTSVSGVESVEVMIVVDSSPEIMVCENTEKTMSSNSSEKISSEAVIIKNNSVSYPIVLVEKCPKVTGVLVVVRCKNVVNTKLNIIKATQTLLGIEADRIEVLEG